MDDIEVTENDDDYYAFLNVARDVSIKLDKIYFIKFWRCFAIQATIEQINSAYKSLSRIYHPDKHTDPDKKKDAEVLFNRIKTAHAVLSDSEQRAIYDLIGTKGLQTEGWELLPK